MPACKQCGLPSAVPTPAYPDGSFCGTCAMGRVQDPRCPFFPGQVVVIDGTQHHLGVVHYDPSVDKVTALDDDSRGWLDLTPLRDRA